MFSSARQPTNPVSRLHYLRQFLRNPRELGSITPSSRFLGRAILGEIDFNHAHRIVELGPGTGVFTREILRQLSPQGSLLALDTNADFIKLLGTQLADSRLTAVHASAERVNTEVANLGWPSADVVISGIPYSLLPRATTAAIARASWEALGDGGLFVGYQYGPYLLPFLRSTFGNCRLKLVVRNLPPAVVFVSHKRATA